MWACEQESKRLRARGTTFIVSLRSNRRWDKFTQPSAVLSFFLSLSLRLFLHPRVRRFLRLFSFTDLLSALLSIPSCWSLFSYELLVTRERWSSHKTLDPPNPLFTRRSILAKSHSSHDRSTPFLIPFFYSNSSVFYLFTFSILWLEILTPVVKCIQIYFPLRNLNFGRCLT